MDGGWWVTVELFVEFFPRAFDFVCFALLPLEEVLDDLEEGEAASALDFAFGVGALRSRADRLG